MVPLPPLKPSVPSFPRLFLTLGVLALGWGFAGGEEAWVPFQLPGAEGFSVDTPVKVQKREGKDEWRATDGGREAL